MIKLLLTIAIKIISLFTVFSQSIKTAEIDSTGLIQVQLTNASSIYIEKKIDNLWIILDSISFVRIEPEAENQSREIEYSITVPLDSGLNIFKVNIQEFSRILEIYSSTQLYFEDYRKKDIITFARKTSYSIRDEKGEHVQSGYVPFLNLKRLPKGIYYINFDNKIKIFIK